MELLGKPEQQAYLYNYLGAELTVRLQGTTSPTDTTEKLFKTMGAMFLEKYPLFQRRLSWFRFKKERSMTLKQCYYHMKRMASEADMSDMTLDEWHLYQLTFISRDEPELFQELLKVEKPTREKILAAATVFENAERSQELVGSKPAYGVTSERGGEDDDTPIMAIPQGACNNCGIQHGPNLCGAFGKLCYECGRSGHFGRVCRSRVSSRPGRSRRLLVVPLV